MIFGSLFSGIEAASVAWLPLGWECAWLSEIEPFPCAVLAHHYPDVPNLGDVTDPDFAARALALGPVDLVCGGSPCQAFSVAGHRQSLADDRGNLTLRFVEIINAIAPRFTLWENVPGVLSTKDNAFGCLLAGLVGEDAPIIPTGGRWTDAGVVDGPRRSVAWRILDAQYFGLAQRRRRVFLLAGRTGDRPHPGEVLFEPDCLPRHHPPSRSQGEDVAEILKSCAQSGGWSNSVGYDNPNYIAFTAINDGRDVLENCTPTLGCGGGGGHGAGMAVAINLRGRECGGTAEMGEGVATALRASQGGADALLCSKQIVRRLVPQECEFLQGFPRNYTMIPLRGNPAEDCPDGPRYKALGNSWAVNVVRWIGQRMEEKT